MTKNRRLQDEYFVVCIESDASLNMISIISWTVEALFLVAFELPVEVDMVAEFL